MLDAVKTLLNILWLVLCGFWLAVGYVVAGVIMCILIIDVYKRQDLHPVLEAGLPHPLLRLVDLLVAQGDADDPGVVVPGGVEGHRPPPTPHVEQA